LLSLVCFCLLNEDFEVFLSIPKSFELNWPVNKSFAELGWVTTSSDGACSWVGVGTFPAVSRSHI
jgi:hypothetical protein